VFVGVARLVISIPGARSLKDRRRVVKSLKDRLRARFPVSVAEVGDLERYQVATLGLATVSNEGARCEQVMAAAVGMARVSRDAVLADVATEVVSFGPGGGNLRGGIEQVLGELDARSFDDDEEELEP
jgi:uncharacterized protein YlxP (DUF503 family)